RGCGPHRGVVIGQRSQFALQAIDQSSALILGSRGVIVLRVQKGLVGRLKIEDELPLVILGVVDQAAQLVQPGLTQPMVDDVDGGPLLAYEQNPLASGDEIGNEVGDRLRFAGSRWALDDEMLAGSR